MHNKFLTCNVGYLVDARISASEKNLPVPIFSLELFISI